MDVCQCSPSPVVKRSLTGDSGLARGRAASRAGGVEVAAGEDWALERGRWWGPIRTGKARGSS